MFVALHDLRHARGRFALMITVIVLVAFLVGFLATLTGGLARASTSAVTDLPADRLAFTTRHGADPDFTASSVSRDQVRAWRDVAGVASAEPLGVATTRAAADGVTAAVTAFGVEQGSPLAPEGGLGDHRVVLSEGAHEELGDVDELAIAGAVFTVAGVADSDASFSHTPVVWMSLDDWQAVGATSADGPTATVVAVHGDPRGGVEGMTALSTDDARTAIGSFSSENGSLRTISGFLVVISALVIGAFFTVWTISRTADIAVLKALGASSSYLLRDAVGQALIVLLLGVGVGTAAATAMAWLLDGALPVEVTAGTVLAPAGLLVAAGLVGAAAAVWRVTRIDPHAALAAR